MSTTSGQQRAPSDALPIAVGRRSFAAAGGGPELFRQVCASVVVQPENVVGMHQHGVLLIVGGHSEKRISGCPEMGLKPR
jgi:hypothetical protein